jgi:hypothetical protein
MKRRQCGTDEVAHAPEPVSAASYEQGSLPSFRQDIMLVRSILLIAIASVCGRNCRPVLRIWFAETFP